MSASPAPLLAGDFAYLVRLVRERSGIVIGPEKQYLVETRLSPLLRAKGIADYATLAARLRAEPTGPLPRAVVEAMTTNETFFFRDQHPFAALEQQVLPKLIAARAALRTLSIWCAASSSGQEPYSIAMILRDRFAGALAGWKVSITATDISAEMIARAKAGIYSPIEVGRGLPAPLLARWFLREGADWRIRDDLRAMVAFRELNLLDPWPIAQGVDVLFCRNVLIYFDDDTKRRLLGRMHDLLRPDGWLFLGGAETTLGLDDRFARTQLDKAGAFQRLAPGERQGSGRFAKVE